MKKSITATSCSGVYFFTGFNPGTVNTALFLFTPPPPSENTLRNRRRAISRMVITQINGLPQGTPSYKSSSVWRFKNFLNTLLWCTQHPDTCIIRAMLIVILCLPCTSFTPNRGINSGEMLNLINPIGS